MKNLNQVFVYGTLKKGNRVRGIDSFSSNSVFIGEAETADQTYSLYDLGSFPAASLDGNDTIVGEVWEVDEEVFQVLDQIEGYPTFYDRKLINTTKGQAWMYYIPDISSRNNFGASKINNNGGKVLWERY